ncbi:type II toxin-antitoxin system RelE/ParE family toxin [Rhizobium sp. RU33A]|uniref:type II toxin-antitoxin system RelE/ParE family toxin n=1 Tax=Rhizobium sp. RU33A TaxID=1907413 RepID=UPI001FCCF2A7|nr:type II toxin-antitoxin system RelE/ParE family toxin [Rhizobium sp. RU33A]
MASFPIPAKSAWSFGTRELLPHPSYRLIYEVANGQLAILAIVHTSRQWPPTDSD